MVMVENGSINGANVIMVMVIMETVLVMVGNTGNDRNGDSR